MPEDTMTSIGSVPVPDPTTLTAEAVDRAKSDLRRELEAQRKLFEERLAGLDRAFELLSDTVRESPSDRDRLRVRLEEELEKAVQTVREYVLAELTRVKSVHDEKFSAVDTRFQERDERTAQAAQESRISLDAALAAAKEAVGEQNKANSTAIAKSELATQKQIDSMETLMQTNFTAMEGRLTDLKGRIDRSEGQDSRFVTRDAFGLAHDTLTNQVQSVTTQIANLQGRSAAFAVAVTLVASAAAILSHFIK